MASNADARGAIEVWLANAIGLPASVGKTLQTTGDDSRIELHLRTNRGDSQLVIRAEIENGRPVLRAERTDNWT